MPRRLDEFITAELLAYPLKQRRIDRNCRTIMRTIYRSTLKFNEMFFLFNLNQPLNRINYTLLPSQENCGHVWGILNLLTVRLSLKQNRTPADVSCLLMRNNIRSVSIHYNGKIMKLVFDSCIFQHPAIWAGGVVFTNYDLYTNS